MNKSTGARPSDELRISVDDARARLLAAITPLGAWESVATRDALGRVLARAVVAPFDVPRENNAAMTGYAVRSADAAAGGSAVRLTVVGSASSGRPFSGVVGAGHAVRVATGAPLPAGADAVVRRESVVLSEVEGRSCIDLPAALANSLVAGENIRRAGENLARGRAALAAGKRVGPAELGLLASLGIAEVTVHRRPRVAFLSVGDDLCALGRPLGPGEVYDSNRYTLFGALTELGVEVLDMGALRNDPAALERALREAGDNADVIITTAGGASADDAGHGFDLRGVLAQVGQVEHWTLDLKPGRPLAFGQVGRAWLFGLPGNPVAVMVSFYQFVIDGLLRLMGVDPIPVRPIFRVPTVDAISRETGRREYRRGILAVEEGEWRVRLAGNRGSGVLRSMSEANCFIVLDAQQASVAAGELVAVQMFEGLF